MPIVTKEIYEAHYGGWLQISVYVIHYAFNGAVKKAPA